MKTKQLLIELIKLAREEASEQLKDVWNLPAPTMPKPQDPYLQLDLRDEASGGRFLNEPDEASHLNRDNREGEYKFLDESNLQLFMRIDGMPTAKRALLYVMRKKHEISDTADVWMTFVGEIDEDLGPVQPHRIRLQTILEPLKFWDTLKYRYPDFDNLLEDTEDDVTEDCCQPFWQFAFAAIRTSPHMFKPGYTTQHKRKKIQRFSWARMLVLLFLPEVELMKELFHAGLAPKEAPSGWHEQARDKMKTILMKHARGNLRAAIQNGWEDLCIEVDEVFVENSLYANYAVPPPPLSAHGQDEQDPRSPQALGSDVQNNQSNSGDDILSMALSETLGAMSVSDEENRKDARSKKRKDLLDSSREMSAPKTPSQAPSHQCQSSVLQPRGKKRDRNNIESVDGHTDSGEDIPKPKKRPNCRPGPIR
ncbi:hypothetical protein P171DRAFT_487089 [Karstenula rhodostoma CBS 690.94]|uniref:Uncharacterized protein n=1 Tax=Karstenula rhodostoma CBS 690.94 TaxID=1392251 RepID=A0A9P4UAD8_9PLEO|nr:hypothetical protein P171DRAFT_487089 [Karstenula rhodostoma CBS 690.94]